MVSLKIEPFNANGLQNNIKINSDEKWIENWFKYQRYHYVNVVVNLEQIEQDLIFKANTWLSNLKNINEIVDYNLTKKENKIFVEIIHKFRNIEEYSYELKPTFDEIVDYNAQEAIKTVYKKIDEIAEGYLKNMKYNEV
jgi:hypothetical protein